MKKIKNSTAAVLLSLSIGLGGVLISIPTSSSNSDNNVAYVNTYVNGLQNKISYIGQNRNITMNNDSHSILTQKNLLDLKECINDEPAEFGEDISYFEFFCLLRKQDNYADIIRQLLLLPKRYQLSLAVLLSQINRNGLKDIEKNFIINLLNDGSLSSQEYALNTISIWNDAELLPYIVDIQANTLLLQRRLEKIINRFKNIT